MPAITSLGIGSGVDINGMVEQLVALERRPLEQMRAEATRLQTQVSSFGKLSSLFSTLRDASNKLASASLWSGATASSSDEAAVAVSGGATAATGRYAVSVQALATSQTVASVASVASAAVARADEVARASGARAPAPWGPPASFRSPRRRTPVPGRTCSGCLRSRWVSAFARAMRARAPWRRSRCCRRLSAGAYEETRAPAARRESSSSAAARAADCPATPPESVAEANASASTNAARKAAEW